MFLPSKALPCWPRAAQYFLQLPTQWLRFDGIQSQQWQTRPSQTQLSDAIPSSMVEPGQGVHVSMTELRGAFPPMSPANIQDFIQHILILQVHNVLLLALCHKDEHMYSTFCKSNSSR